MSFTIFNKKYEALIKKEIDINSYYNPLSKKSKKHRHLDDIHKEVLEDLDNYGFPRFSWKLTNQIKQQKLEQKIKLASQHCQDDKQIPNLEDYSQGQTEFYQDVKQTNNRIIQLGPKQSRPQTAQISQIRPITAISTKYHQQKQVSFNNNQKEKIMKRRIRPQTAIIKVDSKFTSKIDYEKQQIEEKERIRKQEIRKKFIEHEEHLTQSKFWKNTQKFVNQKQIIRNEQALNDLVFLDNMTNSNKNIDQQEDLISKSSLYKQVQSEKNLTISKLQQQQQKLTQELEMSKHLRESWIGTDLQSAESHFNNEKQQLTRRDFKSIEKQFKESILVLHKNSKILNNSANASLEGKYSKDHNLWLKEVSNNQQNKSKSLHSKKLKFKNNQQVNEDDNDEKQQSIYMSRKKKKIEIEEKLKLSKMAKYRTKEQQVYFEANFNNNNKLIIKQLAQLRRIIISQQIDQSNIQEVIKFDIGSPSKLKNLRKDVKIVSKDLISLRNIKWSSQLNQKFCKDSNLNLVVIDVNTMNLLKFDNIFAKVDEIYINFKNELFQLNFSQMFLELKRTKANLNNFNISDFYYVIIFAKQKDHTQLILFFERFIYNGTIGRDIEQRINDCIMAFYFKFLTLYDTKHIQSVNDIITNSLLILVQRNKINLNLRGIFDQLKNKEIFLEDQLQTNKIILSSILSEKIEGLSKLASPTVNLTQQDTQSPVLSFEEYEQNSPFIPYQIKQREIIQQIKKENPQLNQTLQQKQLLNPFKQEFFNNQKSLKIRPLSSSLQYNIKHVTYQEHLHNLKLQELQLFKQVVGGDEKLAHEELTNKMLHHDSSQYQVKHKNYPSLVQLNYLNSQRKPDKKANFIIIGSKFNL